MRPTRAVRRCNPSDLARQQPQTSTVEGAAKGHSYRRIPVPAQFKHGCLFTGECERRAKPGRIAAGVNDEVTVALCGFRHCKTNTKASCQFRACRIDVDQRHLGAWKL